mmetsp:Transcript_14379/g.38262  ORF Transcript_14379/g.38262 Transcript_14379/m.38262 type:complete len:325 (-) Transcript_14379:1835-2809(-)
MHVSRGVRKELPGLKVRMRRSPYSGLSLYLSLRGSFRKRRLRPPSLPRMFSVFDARGLPGRSSAHNALMNSLTTSAMTTSMYSGLKLSTHTSSVFRPWMTSSSGPWVRADSSGRARRGMRGMRELSWAGSVRHSSTSSGRKGPALGPSSMARKRTRQGCRKGSRSACSVFSCAPVCMTSLKMERMSCRYPAGCSSVTTRRRQRSSKCTIWGDTAGSRSTTEGKAANTSLKSFSVVEPSLEVRSLSSPIFSFTKKSRSSIKNARWMPWLLGCVRRCATTCSRSLSSNRASNKSPSRQDTTSTKSRGSIWLNISTNLSHTTRGSVS